MEEDSSIEFITTINKLNNKRKLDLNDNHKTKKKLTDLNYLNESNKSTNLNKLTTNQNDNLLSVDTNEWILKFNWDLKEKLVQLLNDYTKLLITDKTISIDKKQLINNKNNLIQLLTKSPLNLDRRSNSSKIIINLNNELKHILIDQLTKNEYFIIDLKDPIDKNRKTKLIEENNNLVTKLINLPAKFDKLKVNNETDVSSEETDESEDESINKSKELNNLKDDKKMENCNLELNKKLEAERIENINLNKQLDESSSISIYCVKKDIKKFFENNNRFYSEPIEFLNINWSISICSAYMNDQKKYLKFYLTCRNEIDDENKWECEISYELILKNNLPNKSDLIKKYTNTTFKKTGSYGYPKFINEDNLFNLENGYIKDDSISLQIKLKVHKIVRNIV